MLLLRWVIPARFSDGVSVNTPRSPTAAMTLLVWVQTREVGSAPYGQASSGMAIRASMSS